MSQPIKSVLTQTELRPLLNQAQSLLAIHCQFAEVAPSYLAQASQILGLQLGTLSIAVANSTLAAKLRQLAPDLVTQLQKKGCEVSSIRVKVQISFERYQAKPETRALSKTAQHTLQDFGATLDDSPLKLALKNLAKNS